MHHTGTFAIKLTDCSLIDRLAEGANTSRAAVIHARTLEALAELQVAGEMVERGVIVPRFAVRDGDRALLTVDFSKLPTPYPYTLMLPQNETEQILSDLLPKHIEFQLYRVLLESAAAEQGARMTAMEAATKNASDLIDHLTLTYNRIRQAAITKEIIEIVSGASAAQ